MLPDKKLDREPRHVHHFYDGEDPEVPEDLVGVVVVHGEGVEGEDDGGEDDAADGEDRDDPGPGGGVWLLEEVPDPPLELTALSCTFVQSMNIIFRIRNFLVGFLLNKYITV